MGLQLSIRQNLIILTAVCVAGAGCLGGAALYFSSKVEQAARLINEQRFAPLSRIQDINTHIKEVRFRLAGVLLDQMPIPGARNQLRDSLNTLPRDWSEFKAAVGKLGDESAKLVADIDTGMPEFERFGRALERAYVAEDKKALEPLLEDQWPIVQIKLVKPLERLLPAMSNAVAQDTSGLEHDARLFRHVVTVVAFIIVVVTSLIAFVITGAIRVPLRKMGELLARIGGGDLEFSIAIQRRDEFGPLFAGIASTQSALRARRRRSSARRGDAPAGRDRPASAGGSQGCSERPAPRRSGPAHSCRRQVRVRGVIGPQHQ
jgi:hypothetical protein